jgi:hypothetical protein
VTGNRRKSLSNFLRDELAPPSSAGPTLDVAESVSSYVTTPPALALVPAEPQQNPVTRNIEEATSAPQTGSSVVPDSVSTTGEGPRYLQLTRKEVRFRDDHLEALDKLARRLQRARRGHTGERITENTLVRVAVAALLQRADDLMGRTEAELLESLLAPPNNRTQ